MQALGDHEPPRHEIVGRGEGSVDVRVVRLHDRVAVPQMAEMLGEDVQVVAVGMERCDVALGPLLAVVAVVVVCAEVRDLVVTEHPDEPARDRRLPGSRVTDDAEHDRPRH